MGNKKLPITNLVGSTEISDIIGIVAKEISNLSDTKEVKIMIQRVTTDDKIHTFLASATKKGMFSLGEFIIPYCKNAKAYLPIMLELVKKGFPQKVISEIFRVSASTVSRILKK